MALDIDYLHRLHDSANLGFARMRSEPDPSRRLVTLITLYASIIELTHGVVVWPDAARTRRYLGAALL
jgi:hypothetical protein